MEDNIWKLSEVTGKTENPLKSIQDKKSITVVELKALIKDLVDTDEDGNPCEVFIEGETGRFTPLRRIWMLNAGNILLKG